ncbi:hypothetical protein M885DRAFT_505017 [Pelagophyceae sp. CCMP2097]|nr:hypothetical protein M885DRAFT_505017 [Pelagophyceae sp. CCMP2097]
MAPNVGQAMASMAANVRPNLNDRRIVREDKAFATEVRDCEDVGLLLRMHRQQESKVQSLDKSLGALREEKMRDIEAAMQRAQDRLETTARFKAALFSFPKIKKKKKVAVRSKFYVLKERLEEFYKLLDLSPSVKANLGTIFHAFDANGDGSISLAEFRAKLDEPRERRPLLARLFLAMDEEAAPAAAAGAAAQPDKGRGTLDMFEFFVGYYSLCALPRGDFLIRALWDLYDTKAKGYVERATLRTMLRETMAAPLPEYLARPDDSLPPDLAKRMRELQDAKIWTSLRPGDVAMRIDVDGDRHVAIVRETDAHAITVQDVYSVDNPLGWSTGVENTFTYDGVRHNVTERVKPHRASDELFDGQLEKFLLVCADKNGDGACTLKEFRQFMRKRVSKGEPSPYATMLQLQAKLRRAGPLTDAFWHERSTEVVVRLEQTGLWSAKELYDKLISKFERKRPPRMYGGEDEGALDPGVLRGPLKVKTRRTQLIGEELISACVSAGFASSKASGDDGYEPTFPGSATKLMRGYEEARDIDRRAKGGVLMVTVKRARGLAKADIFGQADPFCTFDLDEEDAGVSTTVIRKTLNPVWDQTFSGLAVPKMFTVRVWDEDRDVLGSTRETLGFANIARAKLWEISCTADRIIELALDGELSSGHKATGTVQLEISWILAERMTDDDASLTRSPSSSARSGVGETSLARSKSSRRSLKDSARPPTPPAADAAPQTGDDSDGSSLSSEEDTLSAYDDAKRPTSAGDEAERPPECRPLPLVDVDLIKAPASRCVGCGFRGAGVVDLLAHVAHCDRAVSKPHFALDLLVLARSTDPEVEAKDAQARAALAEAHAASLALAAAAAAAPPPSLEAAPESPKRRRQVKAASDKKAAPVTAAAAAAEIPEEHPEAAGAAAAPAKARRSSKVTFASALGFR